MHITKKKLEILLESCKGYSTPKIKLEQYVTPSSIAAEMLHTAHLKGDIKGKSVYDLGCGTGKLAIGAALLGARKVCGIDIDENALAIAGENAALLKAEILWLQADVKDIKAGADTVVQNPPFGVHKKGSDIIFLKKAFEIADVIYSMHKGETKDFILRCIEKLGGRAAEIMNVKFNLPYSYKFHRKKVKKISVDIYRITKE